METRFHKHILSWQTWNTWRYQKEWESFKFGMQAVSTFELYSQTL
jgi:hypothetical protein